MADGFADRSVVFCSGRCHYNALRACKGLAPQWEGEAGLSCPE